NCWLYSHASWAESMHKSATGEEFDISQSYWTYWHWFDQIAGGFSSQISTGGNYTTANNIVRKYGLMAEKDFIFADTLNEMSNRQKSALDALNLSLKSGALQEPASRRDKKKLREEMDRAWGLSAEQSALLDQVFGETVSRTLTGSASVAGTPIIRAQDFDVSYSSGPNRARQTRKLSQAMSEWRQVFYSSGDRRGFLQRVQRALHAEQPVIITWFVDFNAMENREGELRGSFNMKTLGDFGPGSQGGHMTVLQDYQAKLADGTVLEAGVTLDPSKRSDKRLLDRALDTRTQIQFLRVKNSWGSARVDRAFAPGMPGYHDLHLDYLNGPVKRCTTKADGSTDTSNCPFDHTPLQNVVLPPGY
ncbi:MAG: hypothetical protein KF850_42340, partial [Labilithrix sp.]|nr:hypothetical protein [Labilithrix sp.]